MTSTAPPPTALLPTLIRAPHFLGLAASVFFLGFGVSLAAPFLSLYGVNQIGMTPLQLGLFLTLNAVSAVLISTRLARWSDRLNDRKPLVLVTLGLGAVGHVALGLTESYLGVLLIGMAMLGTGAAAFPQVFAFARTQLKDLPGDLAERSQTILRSMFSLAWVVGPGLGAVALARFDFAGVFFLAALCLALAALPIVLSRAGHRANSATQAVSSGPHKPATPARPLPWVAVAFVLYGMSMIMAMNMFPLFITKTLGGTTGEVGFLVSLCALLEIPIMLALVTLRRLPSVEWLVKGAMGLFVLHFALMALAQEMTLLVVTQVIRSLVLAILAGLGMTYFQQLMPGRVGTATTLFSNTMNVGGMLAGIVSGAWAQAFGYREVYVLCAALTFAAWAVMQVITRPGRRAARAPRERNG
ncbi:sugar efflux transporter [Deinococcus koreensis]|uniref:MFS transporter n=1 Tax=Deinococcus koreensis TaxID=2054903 RepID=A0A2K3UTZ6_9DEIO|nr:sugar efflux transporter [Deinococcus koreensis]PNY80006.1 MFS transporter [Deinococcus koreensis]